MAWRWPTRHGKHLLAMKRTANKGCDLARLCGLTHALRPHHGWIPDQRCSGSADIVIACHPEAPAVRVKPEGYRFINGDLACLH